MTVRETSSTSLLVRNLNIWSNFFETSTSVLFRDWFSRRVPRMDTQRSQQPNRVAFLRHRQATHRPLEPLDVRRKHLVNQRPPLRGQLAEHHARILPARAAPHQP